MNHCYKPIHSIACGVLRLDMAEVARKTGVEISEEYLEGGLHSVPIELRTKVQERIDAASESGVVTKIIIGYGICGRGTAGLYARNVPLVIPKVHDCIALFLGSNKRYREEFSKNPGTYYISAGWFEEKVQPTSGRERKTIFNEKGRGNDLRNLSYDYLEQQYGTDNAEEITRFYNSWKKNYKRSVFIDSGAGDKEKYAAYARDLADEFGWNYEEIIGTGDLLEKLITADRDSEDILWVPPKHVTEFNAMTKQLMAVPQWKTKKEKDEIAAESTQSGPLSTSDPDSQASIRTDQEPPERVLQGRKKRRMGLGIDAGGTYTDVAVYDFERKKVLSKGKALTTRWDFTIGIENAIDRLHPGFLSSIDLVSVSTTLATNAIVEGHGQKVGLLLMPSGVIDQDKIENSPVAVIKGKLNISGTELEPIDPEQIARIALEMKEKDGVSVFAVSGYGGSVNPVHELKVKKILIEETGLYVCCGHELSDLLNFYVRANTAVLNARIIPLLEKFIQDVERSLLERGINVPIMVVKGDGSLMSTELAQYRPIETILSGPAASIAGARFLTGVEDATVIDIGGTTSDIGCINQGAVEVCPQGASVGGWRTHVKALNMSTVGLGGDSSIQVEDQEVIIGPRRIAPLSWLAQESDITEALHFVEEHRDDYNASSKPLQFFTLTGSGEELNVSSDERAVVEALQRGACSVLELAERVGVGHWMMLRTKRLEDHFIIQRCGLTPTDLLHVRGILSLWEEKTATMMTDIIALRAGFDRNRFINTVFDIINRKVTEELIKKQLDVVLDEDELSDSHPWQVVMGNILNRGNGRIKLSVTFNNPIIGLGAPVRYFLELLPRKIDSEIIIPQNAEVANAIGAITSSVTVSKRVRVLPTTEGTFSIQGFENRKVFDDFEEASVFAERVLKETIIDMARLAGTSEEHVEMEVDDRITKTADGAELFLERILIAEVTGIPDLAQ